MDEASLLKKESQLTVSLGLMLVLWDVLTNRLAGSAALAALNPNERRALWVLEDLCEAAIAEKGVRPLPADQWEQLMTLAREHVRKLPVEFSDEG